MRPTEVILAVILATVVVMDVKIPAQAARFVGSVPGMVVILGIVFYLFSQSTILGVLGILAAFIVVQHSGRLPVFKQSAILPNANVNGVSPMSQFPVTLEEIMVKNLVPMVNSGPGTISTSFGNTHDAADV